MELRSCIIQTAAVDHSTSFNLILQRYCNASMLSLRDLFFVGFHLDHFRPQNRQIPATYKEQWRQQRQYKPPLFRDCNLLMYSAQH